MRQALYGIQYQDQMGSELALKRAVIRRIRVESSGLTECRLNGLGCVSERRNGAKIEKVSPTIMNPLLSDLQVSLKIRMFCQVQSLIGSQLHDTGAHVNTVRT